MGKTICESRSSDMTYPGYGLLRPEPNIGQQVPLEGLTVAMLAMLENMAIPVWFKNLGGQYLYVNRCYADMLGMSPEDIVGRHDLELPLILDFDANSRHDMIACGRVDALVTEDFILVPGNEQIRVRATRRRVVRNEQVIGVTAFLQPITPDEIDLECKERRLRQHYGQVAHELRTPLGGVL